MTDRKAAAAERQRRSRERRRGMVGGDGASAAASDARADEAVRRAGVSDVEAAARLSGAVMEAELRRFLQGVDRADALSAGGKVWVRGATGMMWDRVKARLQVAVATGEVTLPGDEG